MGIRAGSKGDKRGQTGFKASKGRGNVELKCVDASASIDAPLTFRISLHSQKGQCYSRSVVTHDFSQKRIYDVVQGNELWNFRSATEAGSKIFFVCLDITRA